MKGKWINIYNGDLSLRSWWVDFGNECEYASIVLPEVFGINHWIRNFEDDRGSMRTYYFVYMT